MKRPKTLGALQISDAVALAKPMCEKCSGTGQMPRSYCGCVYRRAFRDCLQRYLSRDGQAESSPRRDGGAVWSWPGAEYRADFELVSARVLAESPELTGVFRRHFLEGAEWTICCASLQMDRGAFFHAVYRIEGRLGRAFLELKPYSLWPRSYFAAPSFAREQFPERRPNEFLDTPHGSFLSRTRIGVPYIAYRGPFQSKPRFRAAA